MAKFKIIASCLIFCAVAVAIGYVLIHKNGDTTTQKANVVINVSSRQYELSLNNEIEFKNKLFSVSPKEREYDLVLKLVDSKNQIIKEIDNDTKLYSFESTGRYYIKSYLDDKYYDKIEINVSNKNSSSPNITILKNDLSVYVGETIQLQDIIFVENIKSYQNKITLSNNNFSLDNGIITALNQGETTFNVELYNNEITYRAEFKLTAKGEPAIVSDDDNPVISNPKKIFIGENEYSSNDTAVLRKTKNLSICITNCENECTIQNVSSNSNIVHIKQYNFPFILIDCLESGNCCLSITFNDGSKFIINLIIQE